MTLAKVTLNIWSMLVTWLVNIVVFFVVGYYFVKFFGGEVDTAGDQDQEEKQYVDK